MSPPPQICRLLIISCCKVILRWLHLILKLWMMIPLPLSQHQANRSPFERFLMTTTAQDGSFKTKNISAPFLRPWAEKKRVIIRVPQNSQQPPSSKFKAKSRDWWAATCCQNYKLPHSSPLVLAHDIFIRHIISHKNQPKVEVKKLKISAEEKTLQFFRLHMHLIFEGLVLVPCRKAWDLGVCSREPSVFSFVFSILGGSS